MENNIMVKKLINSIYIYIYIYITKERWNYTLVLSQNRKEVWAI